MIEILVGMIASGKSTYSKARACDGCVVINDDDIVNAVHAGQYTLYREELKPLYKGVEVFMLNTAIAMGKSCVIDKGLNLSKTSRQRWISLARSLDVPVQCVLFQVFTPEIHAARRSEFDGRGHNYDYWLHVTNRHFEVYDPPSLEEGFTSIHTVGWQT